MRKLPELNIRCVEHLCRHLHCSQRELQQFYEHPEDYYRQTEIEVRGKKRPIAVPRARFREILDSLQRLLSRIALPSYLHGGVKEHSCKTNASPHIGKPAVLKFDLEDFFPRVRPSQVYRLFNTRLGCSRNIARILTRLVSLNGGLPQGSPTSTTIANLVIIPLARRLNALAAKHGCDYSQFVDDGTISGPGYIERLRPLVERIIRQEGFQASPKPHKRITSYRNEEQIVTGVKVNKQIDTPSDKILEVNGALNELRSGLVAGQPVDRQKFASIKGKIQYIRTLNAEKGRRLQNRLNRILAEASHN